MSGERFINFESNLPDDSQEDSSHNVISPAGKNIADRIAKLLAGNEVQVTPVQKHSFYGWSFIAEYRRVRFYCLLQAPGKWLLLIRPKLNFFDRLLFRKAQMETDSLFHLLLDKMRAESQFTNVQVGRQGV